MFIYIRYILLVWTTCRAQFKNTTCYSEAGIGCVVYFNLTAEGCSNLENWFPALYHREENLYPNKPSLFNLTPIEQVFGNSVYPGANVTFKVPADASFKSVKGFELFRRAYEPNKTACFIFAFNGSELNSSMKSGEIRLKIWPIYETNETLYDFEVFSLPKPPENDPDYNRMSIKRPIIINKYYSLTQPSANWVTTISYYSSSADKYIYIEFAKPPDQYGFKEFIIRLKEYDSGNLIKEVVTADYKHWFNLVQPGTYKVTVEPKSAYNDCYCYNIYTFCVPCIATATNPIVIENVTDPTTKPPSTQTPYPSVTTVTPTMATQGGSYGGDETQKIIAAVLGSVIGVLLTLLLGYFIYSRRKRQGFGDIFCPKEQDYPNPPEPPEPNDYDFPAQKPTVYIVNAEDHPHHVKAVEAFARFLDHHCQCHVMYAPWNLHEVLDDKFRWVINTIEKADYVIIVNSKLSFHQFKSWKNKENREWKSPSSSRTFDLFLSSINQIAKHIININNHFKCIVVHFDYTSNKFSLDELCMGAQYYIPVHMHDLMCHVHQLDNRRTGYDNGAFYSDLINATSDGQYLLQCISMAANYEKQNPNWFQNYFQTEEQFDSGISSPSTSLRDDRNIINTQNPGLRNSRDAIPHIYQNGVNNVHPQYQTRERIKCQTSVEDNTDVTLQHSDETILHPLRYSDPSSEDSNIIYPPDYFEEPSIISEEDILSQQLRQEIYELNNRMLNSQNDNLMLQIINTHSDHDEIQSLGGQSV